MARPVDSPGWASLRFACMAMGKPRKDFDPAGGCPGDLVRYLEESGAATLLVVGPREHERPGIEAAALEYLAAAVGMAIRTPQNPRPPNGLQGTTSSHRRTIT